jgi:hypothetical protein
VDHLLTLDEVSDRTGEPAHRLRRWCATGSLACELDGHVWRIHASTIPAVHALAKRRRTIVDDRRAIAMAVPKAIVTYDLGERVENAMGLPSGGVSTSTLVVDGEEHIVAVWSRLAGSEADHALSDLADELGGDLLDGELGGRLTD